MQFSKFGYETSPGEQLERMGQGKMSLLKRFLKIVLSLRELQDILQQSMGISGHGISNFSSPTISPPKLFFFLQKNCFLALHFQIASTQSISPVKLFIIRLINEEAP